MILMHGHGFCEDQKNWGLWHCQCRHYCPAAGFVHFCLFVLFILFYFISVDHLTNCTLYKGNLPSLWVKEGLCGSHLSAPALPHTTVIVMRRTRHGLGQIGVRPGPGTGMDLASAGKSAALTRPSRPGISITQGSHGHWWTSGLYGGWSR